MEGVENIIGKEDKYFGDKKKLMIQFNAREVYVITYITTIN
jgi:hypothetical protein